MSSDFRGMFTPHQLMKFSLMKSLKGLKFHRVYTLFVNSDCKRPLAIVQ
jgi:hypothetical protein